MLKRPQNLHLNIKHTEHNYSHVLILTEWCKMTSWVWMIYSAWNMKVWKSFSAGTSTFQGQNMEMVCRFEKLAVEIMEISKIFLGEIQSLKKLAIADKQMCLLLADGVCIWNVLNFSLNSECFGRLVLKEVYVCIHVKDCCISAINDGEMIQIIFRWVTQLNNYLQISLFSVAATEEEVQL